MSSSAEVIRAFLYAAITALVIVGLAYLLGREASRARDQAYFEIHDHRVAAACANAELVEGINRLLEAHGLELIGITGAEGLDCDNLPAVQPEASE